MVFAGQTRRRLLDAERPRRRGACHHSAGREDGVRKESSAANHGEVPGSRHTCIIHSGRCLATM
jgi:hypothetical protein